MFSLLAPGPALPAASHTDRLEVLRGRDRSPIGCHSTSSCHQRPCPCLQEKLSQSMSVRLHDQRAMNSCMANRAALLEEIGVFRGNHAVGFFGPAPHNASSSCSYPGSCECSSPSSRSARAETSARSQRAMLSARMFQGSKQIRGQSSRPWPVSQSKLALEPDATKHGPMKASFRCTSSAGDGRSAASFKVRFDVPTGHCQSGLFGWAKRV